MMAIFRVGAVVPIAIAAVTAAAGLLSGSVQINVVAFALAVGLFAWFGLGSVAKTGEQAAVSDGHWLLETMTRLA